MSVFYFNRLPVTGPWGGGNKTLSAIAEKLISLGHIVTGEMRSDVSCIFCIDPRPAQNGIWYEDIFKFSRSVGAPIVQRVGDVGTHGKPDLTALVRWSTSLSDRVIFTSEWARDYIGCRRECRVIPNGPLPVFYETRRGLAPCSDRPKIVTHHWSNNALKGLSLYERLANDIDSGRLPWEFTYIGRSSLALERVTKPPVDAHELSRLIPQHDVYLTASVLEAGANHVLEAIACGLPAVHHADGGSIPEYCDGRGVSFRSYEEMISSIESVIASYDRHLVSTQSYTRTMNDVVDEYVEVLCGV